MGCAQILFKNLENNIPGIWEMPGIYAGKLLVSIEPSIDGTYSGSRCDAPESLPQMKEYQQKRTSI